MEDGDEIVDILTDVEPALDVGAGLAAHPCTQVRIGEQFTQARP
jgi:hypothetical protein